MKNLDRGRIFSYEGPKPNFIRIRSRIIYEDPEPNYYFCINNNNFIFRIRSRIFNLLIIRIILLILKGPEWKKHKDYELIIIY